MKPGELPLGACPSGQHKNDFRQCGFAGCVDLRPWAKARRYRYRLEESYKAETDGHVKGDGRWFVEVLCRYGMICPKGGDTLLAYATRGVKRHIAALGADIQHHQFDDDSEVFRVPIGRLDEVAAILKPRRRRTLDPNRARAIGKATSYGAQSTESDQEVAPNVDEGESLG